MRAPNLLPAVLTALLLAQGCATRVHKPYEVPRALTGASSEQMLAAAERNARSKGWAVVPHDENDAVVEAISPGVLQGGVETREHWFFRADAGNISAQRVFEVRWSVSDTRWESTEVVSPGYGYTREHEELTAIASSLDLRMPPRKNTRGSRWLSMSPR